MSDVAALLDGERKQHIQAGKDKSKRNNELSYNPFGPALGTPTMQMLKRWLAT